MVTVTQIIEQGHGPCAYCKCEEDLRPYGRDGAWICFTCAMGSDENKEEARRQLFKLLKDSNALIIVIPADNDPDGEPHVLGRTLN